MASSPAHEHTKLLIASNDCTWHCQKADILIILIRYRRLFFLDILVEKQHAKVGMYNHEDGCLFCEWTIMKWQVD